MPDGVERQRFRWARKASTLEGVAARRARRGKGAGLGDGRCPGEGMGSPEGRSAMTPVEGWGSPDIVFFSSFRLLSAGLSD